VIDPVRSGRARILALMAATGVLLVAGVAVRGIEGELPPAPEDLPVGPQALAEPMQFVMRGGGLRMRELAERIDPARRAAWDAAWRLPYDLEGCPELLEWIDGPSGQKLERLLADLSRGTRDEALAALAITVQVARTSRWKPGFFDDPENAERLGGLLQDWLRRWGPQAADDPQLLEPTLAGLLLYGYVMRTAYTEPAIGVAEAPYERARGFLDQLTGARAAQRTPLGERMATRYPRAWSTLVGRKDFLQGAEEEARALFPEIDGECGG